MGKVISACAKSNLDFTFILSEVSAQLKGDELTIPLFFYFIEGEQRLLQKVIIKRKLDGLILTLGSSKST